MCEIVDDQLLGEGVLATVADARRRLLAPDACILPRAGALFALAVELRPPAHAGLQLDDHNLFLCDLPMTPEPLASAKLQHVAPGAWKQLAKPVRLFEWQWATAPIGSLRQAGSSTTA